MILLSGYDVGITGRPGRLCCCCASLSSPAGATPVPLPPLRRSGHGVHRLRPRTAILQPLCRQQQRAQQLREAGQRYQRRERGRLLHAARQRAYMATRSVSPPAARPQATPAASQAALQPPLRATRPLESLRGSSRSAEAPASPTSTEPCCCSCGRRSYLLLRRSFLRRRQR
jgi:hypothetical protein